jgi:hypothetical protein
MTSFLSAEVMYKYSYTPKTVYENQLFPVTIIGIGATSAISPQFTFDSQSDIIPIKKKPLIIRNGNDSFYTFYFKAKDKDIRIPFVNISSSLGKSSLRYEDIKIEKLELRADFSNILATDLKIKHSQVSNYDERNSMLTLSIEAIEANIENMLIKGAIEFGIESISRTSAKVNAEVYIIIPSTQTEVEFSYFNTLKNQYILLNISTVIQDSSVSTQSNLNPKEDNFEKLKKYGMIFLSIFFTLMFLLKRDFFYLILGAISIITLLTLFIPHKKICISQGSPLYLLPMDTSTISTYAEDDFQSDLLATRTTYTKVVYQNNIIGWIKNENICKN